MDVTLGCGRTLQRTGLRTAVALLTLLVVACGVDPVEPPDNVVKPRPPQVPSRLTVRVATTGNAFDPDGFTVLQDGDSVATVDVNGTAVLWVEPGTHRFELGSVAPNCTTTGILRIRVPANSTQVVRLSASCVSPGALPVMRILVASPSGLVAMNTDGTDRVVLMTDSTIATPDVTSDGRRMTYVQGTPTGYGDLWVADVDGDNRTQLVTGAPLGGPHWSPDGQRIAYVDFEGVRLIHADGAVPSTLLSSWLIPDFAFYSAPAWSPDGTRVAVTYATFDAASRGLVITSLKGDLSFLITSVVPVGWPAWSVDDRIAYVADDGSVKAIHPDGTGETTLLAGREDAAAQLQDWSPGGAWLLYTDRNPFGGTDLYLLSPSDGLTIRVTSTGDIRSAAFLPEASP